MHHAEDAAIIGTKIVTPVGDAVRLVYHEQTDPPSDLRQNLGEKVLIGPS